MSKAALIGGAPAMNMMAPQANMAMQAMQVMRPGDWKCYGCANINYASREDCNRCGVSKNVFIKKTGMRPGDWVCSACNNHNYADKTLCNKCKAAKSPSAIKQPTRPGDWMCPACNNHNYASKLQCNKCSAGKPI